MRYLARRSVFYLIAAYAAITLNFFLPRMMVGDPVQMMLGRFQGRMDPSTYASLRETFGFVDGPLPEQYFTYLEHLAHGDLGVSLAYYPSPVSSVIGPSVLWTSAGIGIPSFHCAGYVLGHDGRLETGQIHGQHHIADGKRLECLPVFLDRYARAL
jgi:peptide/nickel transport system permease protein